MQRPEPGRLAVAVALHDVSPATWPECEAILAMLDETGAGPLSLLVVPHFHYRAPVTADRGFRRAMDDRLARGDELVLHGMHHVDAEPPPRTLRGFVERRLLTRSEGEFAALSAHGAAWRLARGIAMFDALGWPLHGFVPPAWLASEGARSAIAQCGHRFMYMTVRRGIHRLPGWQLEPTANLCYSPDSALRRLYSRLAIRNELRHAKRMSLLRISLHPQDSRVPGVVAHWRRLVVEALAQRRAVTKHAWVSSQVLPDAVAPGSSPTAAPRERASGRAAPARAMS
jgi:predicted deacetylase